MEWVGKRCKYVAPGQIIILTAAKRSKYSPALCASSTALKTSRRTQSFIQARYQHYGAVSWWDENWDGQEHCTPIWHREEIPRTSKCSAWSRQVFRRHLGDPSLWLLVAVVKMHAKFDVFKANIRIQPFLPTSLSAVNHLVRMDVARVPPALDLV